MPSNFMSDQQQQKSLFATKHDQPINSQNKTLYSLRFYFLNGGNNMCVKLPNKPKNTLFPPTTHVFQAQ